MAHRPNLLPLASTGYTCPTGGNTSPQAAYTPVTAPQPRSAVLGEAPRPLPLPPTGAYVRKAPTQTAIGVGSAQTETPETRHLNLASAKGVAARAVPTNYSTMPAQDPSVRVKDAASAVPITLRYSALRTLTKAGFEAWALVEKQPNTYLTLSELGKSTIFYSDEKSGVRRIPLSGSESICVVISKSTSVPIDDFIRALNLERAGSTPSSPATDAVAEQSTRDNRSGTVYEAMPSEPKPAPHSVRPALGRGPNSSNYARIPRNDAKATAQSNPQPPVRTRRLGEPGDGLPRPNAAMTKQT
jgi:hypothetical protein